MKFEVGQKWINGKGDLVEIIDVQGESATTYPVVGDNGAIYTSEGTYWPDRGSEDDLVELVDESEVAEQESEVAEQETKGTYWSEVAEQETELVDESEVAEQETEVAEQETEVADTKSYLELVGKDEEPDEELEAKFIGHIKDMKEIIGKLMYTAANRGDVTSITNLTIKLTALNKLGK